MNFLRPKNRARLLVGGSLKVLALSALGFIANAAGAQTTATATPSASTASDGADAIVVTGSRLRRTGTETASPITVISQTELTSGGITNVSEAIRSVSADSAGSISTGFQNGFSAGGSGVSLRGLGVSSTLVLIDGLRSTNYPLSDDGHNSYTDLNTIPFSMIDRVEVLKDGASSIYGADAIGGVVNIITKKHVTGVSANLESGVSGHGDAGRYRANMTAGIGEYSKRGWNFYLNAEYQKDNPVFSRDRGFPYTTYDLSSIGGPDENRMDDSLTIQTPNAVVVRTRQTDLNNPLAGGILTAEQAAGQGYATYTTLNSNCQFGSYTVTTGSARGTGCAHNSPLEYGQIAPSQERYSVSGRLSLRIGSNVEGYVTGSYAHNEVYIQSRGGTSGKATSLGPRPIRDRQPFGASGSLATQNPGIVLPVYVCASGMNCATAADRRLNPNNPYAAAYANDPANGAARIFYLFGDVPFNTDRTYRVLRGTAGLAGSFDGFDWRVDAAAAKGKLMIVSNGYLNLPGLVKAINTGSYNFVDPSQNSAEVRSLVSPTIRTPSNSSLYSIEGSISKVVAALPGGPLQVVVGAQARREAVANNSISQNQVTIAAPTASTFGKHTITAAFFEIDAPIIKQLDLNASGRYDHYSEGFSHFSPKLTVKFTPVRQLALRATYERGFRAPNFAENNPASSFAGFASYTPNNLAGCVFTIAHGGSKNGNGSCNANGNPYVGNFSTGQALIGNPDLKPELSRSLTAGLVFQPTPWFSMTMDYYNIRKTGVIVSAPLLSAARVAYFNAPNLDAARAAVAAIGPGYSVNTVDAIDPAFPNALPRVLIINGPYVNAGRVDTSGLDVSATAKIRLGSGAKLTSRLEFTDIFKYNLSPGGGAPVQRYVGTIGPYELSSGAGTPKWRGSWQNSLDLGSVVLTGTAYYVSRIKNVAADEGTDLSCAGNLLGTGDKFCYIRRFITVDLNARFRVKDRFEFYLNAMNALNAHAPIAPSSYSGVNYLPSWHYAGVVGRTFSAGVNVKL